MVVRFMQKSGEPVAVNPALVRKVRPGQDGTTIISFDKEDQLWVQRPWEEVVQMLDGTL